MVHTMGNVISTEARAKYNQAQREGNHRIFYGLTFWSPNINIFRDPRWGRGQETYGEDPFLTGRMGIAFIGGVQGSDLESSARRRHQQAFCRAQRPRAAAPRIQRGSRRRAILKRPTCPPSAPP